MLSLHAILAETMSILRYTLTVLTQSSGIVKDAFSNFDTNQLQNCPLPHAESGPFRRQSGPQGCLVNAELIYCSTLPQLFSLICLSCDLLGKEFCKMQDATDATDKHSKS
jgi:hypothetical protein